MRDSNNGKPRAGGLRASGKAGLGGHSHLSALTALYSDRMPANWRNRLPAPADYYQTRVAHVGPADSDGMAAGTCPFHDDVGTSLRLRINGVRGGWRCEAGCGAGDMIAFHQRVTGLPFKHAVQDLLRGAGR